jgi:hypothetical protein
MHAEWPMHDSGLSSRARPSVIARMFLGAGAHARTRADAFVEIDLGVDRGRHEVVAEQQGVLVDDRRAPVLARLHPRPYQIGNAGDSGQAEHDDQRGHEWHWWQKLRLAPAPRAVW